MTNTLLTTVDFAKFQGKDPNWFLDAVADTITNYCGWHIAPSLSVTNCVAKVGSKGIVVLPSLHVTSVEALRINGSEVDPVFYNVNDYGTLQFRGFVKPPRNIIVSVDFTHGYESTPPVVAEVGFELAATVLEKASGVVTDLTRGPTMMKFKEFGIVLSPGQEERLQPFRLWRV